MIVLRECMRGVKDGLHACAMAPPSNRMEPDFTSTLRWCMQRCIRKGHSGLLRSLTEFLGVGKQQDVASIVAAVKAAKRVGHPETDRRRPRAFIIPDEEAL
jgi:hypothetical protein